MKQNEDRFAHVSELRSILDEGGWWHSFELPDGRIIRGANSLESLRERIGHFGIPDDLRGQRVLDIGTWDGWFAFEMERRGADVMAVDVIDNPRFREIHRLTSSKIDYRQINVYNLLPAEVGQFDIVLFMGVLYHLKHPLFGLERVCALTKGMAAVDSFVLNEKFADGIRLDRPLMEFFETDEFGGQVDNWVAPNVPCLLAFCRTAGFARAELRNVGDFGASVNCLRDWPPAGTNLPPTTLYAIHHTTFGINFDSRADDYLNARFHSEASELTRAEVFPRVGPFGVNPTRLHACGENAWEVNFPLPPGLPAGWHEVRLATRDSAESNAVRVAIDLPVVANAIRIHRLEDGITWTPGKLIQSEGQVLSVWVSGLPENADVYNVRAQLARHVAAVEYVQAGDRFEERQVNIRVPSEAEMGEHLLSLEVGTASVQRKFEIC